MKNEVLLTIARDSIKETLYGTTLLDKKALLNEYPFLDELQATFVTLTINQNLRGCIGSLIAQRSLYDDLVSNAKSAAFHDPRFQPLSQDEFASVKIEISLLSQPQALQYENVEELKSKINVKTHGVILQYNNHRATFLPQVWEQLPTFELFFQHLCAKAGVSVACLEDKASIYTYKVEKIQ